MVKGTKNSKNPPNLTKYDLDIANFIESYRISEGISPTRRVLAEAFEKSLASIQFSVSKLIAHGRIETEASHGRGLVSLRPLKESRSFIPLLGSVAAGRPIEAIEGRESIEVPAFMMKPNASYYVLRVQGESMIEDQIQNNDFVLIRESQTAKNGERVVALINNEATLKRFERKIDGRVLLHPANATMKPIEVGAHQELRIAGIYAGVLRKIDG